MANKIQKLDAYLKNKAERSLVTSVSFGESIPDRESFDWNTFVKPKEEQVRQTEPIDIKPKRIYKKNEEKKVLPDSKYDTSMYEVSSSSEEAELESEYYDDTDAEDSTMFTMDEDESFMEVDTCDIVDDSEINLVPVRRLHDRVKEQARPKFQKLLLVNRDDEYTLNDLYGFETLKLFKAHEPIRYGKRGKQLRHLGDVIICGICKRKFQRRNTRQHMQSDVHISSWTKLTRKKLLNESEVI